MFPFAFLTPTVVGFAFGLPIASILCVFVYTRATCGRFKPKRWPNLENKVAIVTGSNVGMNLFSISSY